jgi:hypothetical protein
LNVMSTAWSALRQRAHSRRDALLAVVASLAGAGPVAANTAGIRHPRPTPPARPTPAPTRRRWRFAYRLFGRVVQPPADACAELGQVCTVGIAGDGRAAPLGPVSFTASLAADFGHPTPTRPGFFVCAPVTGRLQLGAKQPVRQGLVVGTVRGEVCINETGPTFFARLAVRHGTGRYRGVRGRASFVPVVGETDFTLTGQGQLRF